MLYQEVMTIPLFAIALYMFFGLYPKIRREAAKSHIENIRIEFLMLVIDKKISKMQYRNISAMIDDAVTSVEKFSIVKMLLLFWFLTQKQRSHILSSSDLYGIKEWLAKIENKETKRKVIELIVEMNVVISIFLLTKNIILLLLSSINYMVIVVAGSFTKKYSTSKAFFKKKLQQIGQEVMNINDPKNIRIAY